MTNKGKTYHSRGGRPPRLYEALEVAWEGIKGKELSLMERTFVEATVASERLRREKRAARLREREEARRNL